MKIDIDHNLKINQSKEGIITHFAKILNFPEYFRQNWDSFEECFADYISTYSDPIEVHSRNIRSIEASIAAPYFGI